MSSIAAELADLVESGSQRVVTALRCAAADGLGVKDLTDLLQVAFNQRNQIDAALTGAIGALDRAAEEAPDLASTMGLSCATWLRHTLHISASAAHAQVHLARALPSLPATAAAYGRGELSGPHASVVVRSVEQVARGGGDGRDAEDRLLYEARERDPRDLLRWGLGLLHRLAPGEMEAEEERRNRRRYLRLAEVFDGGYELEGYLDPEGGATLKTALQGLLGPRRRDDERSPGQRRPAPPPHHHRHHRDPARRSRRPGGAPRLGLPHLRPGPTPDRPRRRHHAHPAQPQGRPAARGPEVPDRDPEDEPGPGRARPALRLAGVRPAA